MKKIPTLFQRDFPDNPKHVLPVVNPGCEWALDGEGRATFKWDGTSVRVRGGELWKRREVKKGKEPPHDFDEESFDETTGKRTGWVPCSRDGNQDKWHFEAFDAASTQGPLADGTYELVGPKVQGNPHGFETHRLIPHGDEGIDGLELTFEGLRAWMTSESRPEGFEGVVWHHPDGRMVKLKRRDFPALKVLDGV